MEIGAAMLHITGQIEPLSTTCVFSSGRGTQGDSVFPLHVKGRSLHDIQNDLARFYNGGTDIAEPFYKALATGTKVDAFVLFTDNETWAGRSHVQVVLNQYRKAMGLDSKVVIVSAAANSFTVGDPKDAKVLNVVGFDASVPSIISEFVG
jgi:hypothetical protein